MGKMSASNNDKEQLWCGQPPRLDLPGPLVNGKLNAVDQFLMVSLTANTTSSSEEQPPVQSA